MVPACEVVTLVCNYHEVCLPPLVLAGCMVCGVSSLGGGAAVMEEPRRRIVVSDASALRDHACTNTPPAGGDIVTWAK